MTSIGPLVNFQNNAPNPDPSSRFARSVYRTPSPFGKVKKFHSSSSSPSLVSVLGSSMKKGSYQNHLRATLNEKKVSVDFSMPRPKQSPMSSPKKRKTPTPRTNDSKLPTVASTPKRQSKVPNNAVKIPMSQPTLVQSQFNTPNRTMKASPCHSSDRFIPNRSNMRIDLCRASILSGEKRRLDFIEKTVTERSNSSLTSLDSTTTSSNTNSDSMNNSNSSITTEILTPIQSEYQARMRGALLSLPIETTHEHDFISANNTNVENSENVQNAISPILNNESGRGQNGANLAYASIPQLQDENVGPSRILSFRGNLVDESYSSLSSGNDASEYRTRTLPQVVTPDPFIHNQLRVLDRSINGSSFLGGQSFQNDSMSAANKVTRRINSAPTRILDAPELVDDYYLNLISWGKDNIVAVALGQCVYLWNAATGDINHLLTLTGSDDFVTSVKWAEKAGHTNYLAVGTHDGPVQLWDTEALRKVRSLGGHAARVGALDWNQHWLSSGGRDSIIIQHDVRSSQHITSTYAGHTQEVCGLAWSDDGTTLASGGNENYLCIWDAAMSMRSSNSGRSESRGNREPPRLTLTQHVAAVKALAWCPFHRGLLASGGGTADRTIKFWNSNSGAVLNSIDTGSQVCSLLWSKHQRELCSSHGFSENQLILWRYPNMTKIQEFKGHTARVSERCIFLFLQLTFI